MWTVNSKKCIWGVVEHGCMAELVIEKHSLEFALWRVDEMWRVHVWFYFSQSMTRFRSSTDVILLWNYQTVILIPVHDEFRSLTFVAYHLKKLPKSHNSIMRTIMMFILIVIQNIVWPKSDLCNLLSWVLTFYKLNLSGSWFPMFSQFVIFQHVVTSGQYTRLYLHKWDFSSRRWRTELTLTSYVCGFGMWWLYHNHMLKRFYCFWYSGTFYNSNLSRSLRHCV